MPYVQVRTTGSLKTEQVNALRSGVANGIGLLPGKTLSSLMIEIVPDCNISLGEPSNVGCAFVEVLVNNDLAEQDLKAYSKHLCELVETVTGIPLERVYVVHGSHRNWHSGRQFR